MIDTIETDSTRRRPGLLPEWERDETISSRRFPKPAPKPGGLDGTDIGTLAGYSPAQRKALRKIEKALRHMAEHLDKTLPVPTLCALAGLSASNFYHKFKLGTGYTPTDFHIRARMHRAGELLKETDLSVKEVSNLLGYDDQFYFSRLFKLVNGISPRDYRVKFLDMHIQRPRQYMARAYIFVER